MDHCDECGFVYADHGVGDVAVEIAELGERYQAVLCDPDTNVEEVTTRPSPDVWSAVEYGCHIRDVLLAQRERLLLALVEEDPTFAPIYRDQRAELAHYAEESPAQVAGEIIYASSLLAWVLGHLDDDAWARTCTYNFPAPETRSVLWLAQHTLHEGEHHLFDVTRVIAS